MSVSLSYSDYPAGVTQENVLPNPLSTGTGGSTYLYETAYIGGKSRRRRRRRGTNGKKRSMRRSTKKYTGGFQPRQHKKSLNKSRGRTMRSQSQSRSV